MASQDRGAAALGEAVAGLGVSVRVLMVGAHPDDEDTPLIAWLARGRHAEVAYLSLTRGDGGQNLIGNELGEGLGVIRTEELLAARRVDGGKQFFTRAYDFGFSKSAEETYRHWPKDSVLGDVIRVVREFRPHIIIPVFPATARAGHGHHQVSALLAEEAWELARDTVRFPASRFGAPWTPLKFYRDVRFAADQATLRINVGEYSPLLGRSFAELAGESRSQHKSQGFGALQRKGAVFAHVRREKTRVNEGTAASAERSMFDGIDTTLARLRGDLPHERQRRVLDSLVALVGALPARVDLRRPEDAFDALEPIARLASRLRAMRDSSPARAGSGRDAQASLAELGRRVDRVAVAALGTALEATVPRSELVLGDSMVVTVTVYNRARRPIDVVGWHAEGREVGGMGSGGFPPVQVPPDSTARFTVPAVTGHRLSQPWWLAEPRRGDTFAPQPPGPAPDAPVMGGVHIRVGEALFALSAPVVRRYADPVRGEIGQPLIVVPAIDVTLDRAVEYAPANMPLDRAVRVHLWSHSRSARQAAVSLRLPAGLRADSATRTVTLDSASAARTVEFRVRGRLRPGSHTIAALVESGGQRFTIGSIPIEYEHITPRRIYRDAMLRVEAVDATLAPAVRTVAYIPGVGDNVAPMLEQLGVPLTVVEPGALGAIDLSRFTTIVVGTRAYESSPELRAANARLLDWVRAGGTMVVQYGQYEMQQPGMMPYPITLGRPHARVTIEEAPVRILRPEHPLLTLPNRIGERDFAGWVQERSLYMPVTFDERYVPLLSMNDPGEQPNAGAILVAPYGSGTYVYTTLSFFRQLPAGVPGPARLFMNMLGARADAAANGDRATTPAVRP